MQRAFWSFLLRWSLALLAVFCGWLVGLAGYMMATNAGGHDEHFYAVWSGYFCLAAWIMVGAPLAALAPNLSSTPRVILATVLTGLLGTVMVVLFFGGFGLPFAALGFVTAAVSMLAYSALVRTFPWGAR